MTAQLLALGLSDEVPSYIGKGFMALEMWIPGGLALLWVWRRLDNGWRAEVARRGRVSANFRARWPADRVWQAPYAELEAEIFSCWQLVIILESRNACRKPDGAAAQEMHRQIVSLHAWVSTLLGPFNAAAAREHRVFA